VHGACRRLAWCCGCLGCALGVATQPCVRVVAGCRVVATQAVLWMQRQVQKAGPASTSAAPASVDLPSP
jgi:hypothetical protein